MAITVIDAMNGMGQDWECSEVLRAEVRRLIDAREKRASQYRREWDGLRALLADAEQRTTESETRAERLHEALSHLVDNKPPNGTCLYCIGHLKHQPHCPVGKALVALSDTETPD